MDATWAEGHEEDLPVMDVGRPTDPVGCARDEGRAFGRALGSHGSDRVGVVGSSMRITLVSTQSVIRTVFRLRTRGLICARPRERWFGREQNRCPRRTGVNSAPQWAHRRLSVRQSRSMSITSTKRRDEYTAIRRGLAAPKDI